MCYFEVVDELGSFPGDLLRVAFEVGVFLEEPRGVNKRGELPA